MTKEQEEAIEIVKKYLNFNEICGTRNFKEALETVLNMLKRQQTDIEIYEKELDKIYKVLNIERGVAGLETAEIIKRLKNTVNEQINMLKEKDKEIDCLKNHVHYKICPNCKKEFRTKRSDTKYCKECSIKISNKKFYKNITDEQKIKRREQAKISMRRLRAKRKKEK